MKFSQCWPIAVAILASSPSWAAPVHISAPVRLRLGFRLQPFLPPSPAESGNALQHASRRAKRDEAQYTLIDAPGAGTAAGQGTTTYAVNSSLVSTGWYRDSDNNYHGYVRASDGTFTEFDADGPASQTQPVWMNRKGTVVGMYFDIGAGVEEGFLRTAPGVMQTFDGGGGGSAQAVVNSVNDKNEAVGNYSDGANYHGFLRLKKGALTQFDAPGATGTLAFDIDDTGTIVGPYYDAGNVYHGYIRTAGGAFTEFDVAGGGTGGGQGTILNSINSKGWIAGYAIDSNSVYHGFVRDSGGGIVSFDSPDAGSGPLQGTVPIEINGRETIAGYYIDSAGIQHGFIRKRGGAIEEFDAPGAALATVAFDIGKHNIVAGWEQDANGAFHGFLRTR